ncbi:hypothetical protein KP509_10G000800 [Ceratopteris richardii]|uniref:Myb-like domain-containing protein n=1 Tax=Ceratopteris richardii TaxID=49495 RepID=A0A8T2TXT6_CERRI|nr:hypothetical protein KP509_10G000800 [Ceratopteris richardii]
MAMTRSSATPCSPTRIGPCASSSLFPRRRNRKRRRIAMPDRRAKLRRQKALQKELNRKDAEDVEIERPARRGTRCDNGKSLTTLSKQSCAAAGVEFSRKEQRPLFTRRISRRNNAGCTGANCFGEGAPKQPDAAVETEPCQRDNFPVTRRSSRSKRHEVLDACCIGKTQLNAINAATKEELSEKVGSPLVRRTTRLRNSHGSATSSIGKTPINPVSREIARGLPGKEGNPSVRSKNSGSSSSITGRRMKVIESSEKTSLQPVRETVATKMCSREKDFPKESRSTNRNVKISESVEACIERRTADPVEDVNSGNGWTPEQDAALQHAYFQIRPSSNFWFHVAKKVPGKTAKDCFDRFYSAHPTPSVPQSRSKKMAADSPVRTIKFSSPMSSLKRKGSSGRGKQGLLKAHKTVRHILRQQKIADEAYEADIFSVVEPLASGDALLWNCKGKTISPSPGLKGRHFQNHVVTPALKGRYFESYLMTPGSYSCGNEKWRSSSSKRSRFDHDHSYDTSRSTSELTLLSPEVLKPEQDPKRLDRFLDILHLRRVHNRKFSSSKRTCHDQGESLESEKGTALPVAAAREAIWSDVNEVLKTSMQKKSNAEEEETGFTSDDAEDDSFTSLEE